MIGIAILGSTGTIGVNTLEVIAQASSRFRVIALTANRNVLALLNQCRVWRPPYAVLVEERAACELRAHLLAERIPTEVLSGTSGLVDVARHPDAQYVMAGIVGAAGLLPNLAAAQAGKRVMLANKESLVMSGQLFMMRCVQTAPNCCPSTVSTMRFFSACLLASGKGCGTLGSVAFC